MRKKTHAEAITDTSPGGLRLSTLVPQVEGACLAPCTIPVHAFISTSVVPAFRGFCDILAIHVEIVRKSGTQKQIADKVRAVAIASISAMTLKASWSPAK